mmetsp:Transcript_31390/g.66857  ORF Transcript_31390/g.66857 Transcript_31390/m.66857 type:complete len:104 (+) Transcript_31390:85-396(+)|eukprot:CAMPEP_0172538358 /NCGR_PEP_ID=MMETSP1067-20121228/9753_1 /TAXON_ID=265564 ORGANISM="Thalassiosira punctigera, Strain Tpunct2005C2" /NCGR_SAMPLE_ID=MMETSP1067 /ASSEMBLY_ACC=CAM_ASM_000444 /LENGTH=103 /DNA_ID=CAMNT_0013323833 /DNA_START=78 /DNA_END=389 /DNA_ORIENTATION=-
MRPPSYLRAAHFENLVGMPIEIRTKHMSGEVQSSVVDKDGKGEIEKTVDHGSYETIDPIEEITVLAKGVDAGEQRLDVTTHGIEVHKYKVEAGEGTQLKLTKA